MTEPNVGSVVSYLQGPRSGLPGYVAVPGITRPGPPPHNLFVAGWLGEAYLPFGVGGEPSEPDFTKNLAEKSDNPPAQVEENLRPEPLVFPEGLDAARLARRAGLRPRLEQALRQAERQGGSPRWSSTTRGPSACSPRPRSAARSTWARSRPPSATPTDAPSSAAAACWRGGWSRPGPGSCSSITATIPTTATSGTTTACRVQRQPHISEMAKRGYHLAGMDRAFAALIDDLAARGRLDSTLVVFLTEFGRTPKINKTGGRDHWGAAGSIFFAGGGTVAGQVIGATDKQGAYPTTLGYSPADVAATIYHALGIAPDTLLHDRQNRPIAVLPAGAPIPGVLAG